MFHRFAGDARRIVIVAYEEARGLGSSRIDPRHIILGVLLSGEGAARRVLEDAGFTVEKVRAELRAESEGHGGAGRAGSDRGGRGSGEGAAAADTPEEGTSVDHAADSVDGGSVLSDEDAEALRAIGIDLDAVRESIEAQFGPDALSGSSDEDAADEADEGYRDCGRGEPDGPWGRGRGPGGRRHGGGGRGPWAPGAPGPGGGRGSGFGAGGRRPGGPGFGERGFGERGPGGRGRGPHGRAGRGRFRIGFDDAAKQALATGLRLAVRDSSRELTAAHLLLGVLDGDDAATQRFIEEYASPDGLASRLRDLMDRAA